MSQFFGFSTRYAVTVTSDFRIFAMMEPVDFFARDGRHFRIPKAATSDLASIPRPAWSLLPPAGTDGAEYALAAFGHDAAYRNTLLLVNADGTTQKAALSKEDCDLFLREAMIACNVPMDIVFAIYEAVRLAGSSAFAGDR